jgi:16S rRNA (guanine527-N7)-methyltransferase
MENKFTVEKDFSAYMEFFLKQNSKLNLISKNDEKYLYEKHIYDSLAIKLTNRIQDGISILDIGCGGGFPCVPIAIEYPNVNVVGIDSIRKKINAVQEIKIALNLNNLVLICDRVENLREQKFDIITSRAVADLSKISEYALPLLKKDGVFVAYKSKKVDAEIDCAKAVMKKYNAKIINIIEYTLPLEEIYQRNLVIIGFKF